MVDVFVHAHLVAQYGHRVARVRELIASNTVALLCLAIVGAPPFRSPAALDALLMLFWLRMTHEPEAIATYLQRMGQLRWSHGLASRARVLVGISDCSNAFRLCPRRNSTAAGWLTRRKQVEERYATH